MVADRIVLVERRWLLPPGPTPARLWTRLLRDRKLFRLLRGEGSSPSLTQEGADGMGLSIRGRAI